MNRFTPSFQFPSGLGRIMYAAELGHPAAQWKLAQLYATGNDVSQDISLAEEYYIRAASSGFRLAQRDLGLHFSESCHGNPQYERAAAFFSAAAGAGCVRSQLELGVLYLYGRGVIQDLQKAKEYFQKSASQGSGTAAALLAYVNLTGCVPPANPIAAWEYVETLARAGNSDAAVCLWRFYLVNFGWVAGTLQSCLELLQGAAHQGHAGATRELGLHLLKVSTTAEEEKNALTFLLNAAKAGDSIAQLHTGNCFASGKGTPMDEDRANDWYKSAAAIGCVEAEYILAKFQLETSSDPLEKATAFTFLKGLKGNGYDFAREYLARYLITNTPKHAIDPSLIDVLEDAATTDSYVAFCLADIYMCIHEEMPVPFKNRTAASFWLQMNAFQTNPYAMYVLGFYLVGGKYLDQNLTDGLALLHCAANLGHADAAAYIAYAFNHNPKLFRNYRYAAAANEFAAHMGDAHAQHNFALTLTEGRGIAINEVQAHFWRNKHAETIANLNVAITEEPFTMAKTKDATILEFSARDIKRKSS